MRTIGRWEAKGGKRYLVLYRSDTIQGPYYHYSGEGCGGVLGCFDSDGAAIKHFEKNQVAVLRRDFKSLRRISP